MKKAFSLLIVITLLLGCEQLRAPKDCSTYAEAADPAPNAEFDWDAIKPGLHAAVGSINMRYPKSSAPVLSSSKSWAGAGWRGERISAQLVLWSKEPVAQIECEFSDFTSKNGDIMSADIAQARFVRYVITDEFGSGCGYRKPADFAASLTPDGLDNVDCFDMEAKTSRPVWITIALPHNAKPGIYTSTMKLYAEGKKHSSFKFEVEVLNKTLPPPTAWKFHLDLWQNPYAVARYHNVEPWTEEHWKHLRPVMTLLAGAGQKVITATLNKRPWGGQTQDAFGSMIDWKKKSDGTWQFDYSIFDRWVKFMTDLGVGPQINCYSMVPWGNEVYYFDEKTGEEIKVKAAPGTKEYAELWTPFLKDFIVHLRQKGWEKRTCIAMDERSPEDMKAMLELINAAAPELKVALADNHKSYKLFRDDLADLCVSHGATVDEDDIIERRNKGFITTWYVCCSHAFPNVFTFSAPSEAAFVGWYTIAADFDGFLRWAYNSWVLDPLTDSRFRTWPAGDTYIVYPDGRSSIRFERLVEGIQDYEKIRILREEFSSVTNDDALTKLKKLNETVDLFDTVKKPDNLDELVEKGRSVLVELSK